MSGWRGTALSSKVHLGVEGQHVPLAGHDERVDLGQRGVGRLESAVQVHQELDRLLEGVAGESELEGQVPGLEAGEPGGRVDPFLEDELGVLGGDLFDLHAALGRGHDDGAFLLPVDDDAEIKLPGDAQRLFDEQPFDDFALRTGLVGDERHPQDLSGQGPRFLHRLGDLDAASLAAPPGVDLGLDDDRRADLEGDLFGLVRRFRQLAAGDGDPVLAENVLGLILVDFHDYSPSVPLCCRDRIEPSIDSDRTEAVPARPSGMGPVLSEGERARRRRQEPQPIAVFYSTRYFFFPSS